MKYVASFFFFLTSICAQGSAQTSPSASLYALDFKMETQDGQSTQFAQFAGAPLIISMFYTSCDYACPLIINNIKTLERSVPEDERNNFRVLLISFDPDTDTPAVLKKLGSKHKIDTKRWTLARTSPDQVENLAAILGIKYKKIDTKTISHTSMITVLSPEGAIIRQTEQFSADSADMAKVLRAAMK